MQPCDAATLVDVERYPVLNPSLARFADVVATARAQLADDDAHDIGDVKPHLRNEIEHFFSIYKDLEPQKSTEVMGFEDRATALEVLAASSEAYGGGHAIPT